MRFVVWVEAFCLEHLCCELICGQTLTRRYPINIAGRNAETPFQAKRSQERAKVPFERGFSETALSQVDLSSFSGAPSPVSEAATPVHLGGNPSALFVGLQHHRDAEVAS
jgi:hypothetical protein